MKRGHVVAVLLTLLFGAGTASARFGFPEPSTSRAEIIEDIYFQITVAGILVFLFVFALLAFILIRYREGGKGRATYEKERDNLKAEMVWTVIPLIIMLWIGVISYQGLAQLDNLDESFDMDEALIIDITASQYAWQAEYQDSGAKVLATANDELMDIDPFYVPADTPLLFRITAVDVIHSFNIHALGTTIDAVPGQINELYVHDGLPASDFPYFTQCKENCRTPGHSYMQALVYSVNDAEYAQWTEDVLSGKGGLQQVVPVEYDGSSIVPLGTDQLALGATVHLQILNAAGSATDFTFAGETVTVPAQGIDTIEVAIQETGTLTVEGGGASLDLTAVEPVTIDVDLGAFVIEPSSLQLDAGTLYVLNVENVHNLPHNLYIGMDGGDGVTDAIWNTGNLGDGDSESIIVVPGEPSTLDMWCAISGHYSSGMFGTVTVA